MAPKRHAPPLSLCPSKKQRVTPSNRHPLASTKLKREVKSLAKNNAAYGDIIPIPANDNENGEAGLSDQDLELLDTYGRAVSFLNSLDHKAIARSKKETERLHSLVKTRKLDVENEVIYEDSPRKHRLSSSEKGNLVKGLPIKLPNGQIQPTGKVIKLSVTQTEDSDSDHGRILEGNQAVPLVNDVSTAARFGRPAVADVIRQPSRVDRIHSAKEQIAGICRDILTDPENSLGLLKRLHTFSLAEITVPSCVDPILNDIKIRKLAMLSQLAVFKDIIPGYRIRPLSEKEKTDQVSQEVAHVREWEQGLVMAYQRYLQLLEAELKGHNGLVDVALTCMCTLLTEANHFNFRINTIKCVVAHLVKRTLDKSAKLCLQALIRVFREDITGAASLEAVRILHRTIKERHFNVHPEVLSCLLHLRLKAELGVRASQTTADKSDKLLSGRKLSAQRSKGKIASQPHLSKKQKKKLREEKEIGREFREAEAEVDKEERAATQTETLKLLFVLYFGIIKNPHPTRLLPAALHGLSRFAHLINVDFFRDLIEVLKGLVLRNPVHQDDDASQGSEILHSLSMEDVHHRLLCILTAFELLSGQGEALNIDLKQFVSLLYTTIYPLGLLPNIEAAATSYTTTLADDDSLKTYSIADMLFRTLNTVFSPGTSGVAAPPVRSAAFSKRLLSASLHWPPATVLRTLDFVGGLISREPKLEVLLSTEDRSLNGWFRPDIDDPEVSHPFGTSFWELELLHTKHWDSDVRAAAGNILNAANM